MKIDLPKTIIEINGCLDVESLIKYRSDIEAVASSIDRQIAYLKASPLKVLEENDYTKKLDKNTTEDISEDHQLIVPSNKIGAISDKIHALLQDESISYPVLTTDHIEKGKLNRSACLHFFQWIIYVNGGAVPLKRYRKTLKVWIASSKLEASFSESTLGAWNKIWREQGHLSRVPGKSGLYSMTKRELRKAQEENGFLKLELSKSTSRLSEQLSDIPFPIAAVKGDAAGDL